ncbi:unnamed protein product, partial [Symbiodinium necroappetens]
MRCWAPWTPKRRRRFSRLWHLPKNESVAADNAEIRRENRFQKIRRPENEKEEGMKLPKKSVPLALLDRPWSAPSSMMQLMTRRVLPEDIVAERVSQLGKTGTVASVPRTLDQKVLQHYGFNSSLVSRIHLLHGMLLRRQGFDKSARWTPARIVDEMDLHIFLQVIGCGLYDPDLDKLLATGSNPLVCQVPANIRKQLLGPTTCTGASRTTQTIRRVMVYLVKMNLVTMADDSTPGLAGDTIHLVYEVNRYAHVDSFTADLEADPPRRLASFDLAEPGSVDAYWEKTKQLVKEWCDKALGGARGARDDGSSSQDEKRPRQTAPNIPTPVNAPLPELFRRKNWKSYPWLSPHQRAALNKFYGDLCFSSAAPRRQRGSESLLSEVQDVRIVTPRSAEVTALSRRIMVPPERVVKYCRQLAEVAGPPSGARVEFSPLYAVRYKCHKCGHLCFLKTAIADHYLKVHSLPLPTDESLFCEPDFYARRLEQAKPPRNPGIKRLRKVLPSKSNKLHLDMGEIREDEEVEDEMEDAEWLQLLATAESLVPLERHAKGLPLTQRPVGPSHTSPSVTWPMLARLAGFSEAYCQKRIRELLQCDPKNQRLVSTLRSEEVQSERLAAAQSAAGRSVSKCLLLSPYETFMSWWKTEFLPADVRRLVDSVLRQWQVASLVSKYKPRSKGRRLPDNVHPSFTLTYACKVRMFGRGGDFIRLQEALGTLSSTSPEALQAYRSFAPESSEGTHLLVLSDAVASNRATLRAVWADSDFYSQAIAKRPPWQSSHEEEDEEEEPQEPEDEKTGSRPPTGIQSHLQLTSDEPTLQSIRVALAGPRKPESFLKWLLVPDEELPNMLPAPVEPVDPMRCFCETKDAEAENRQEDSEEEEAQDDDIGGDALPSQDQASTDKGAGKAQHSPSTALEQDEGQEVLEKSFKEFASIFLDMPSSAEAGLCSREQDLLDAAAFVFKTVHSISSAASAEGDLTGLFVLPGATTSQLKAAYQGFQGQQKGRKRLRRAQPTRPVSLSVVLACLEELRLLVPFPCGQEFREVLAHAAAPFCVSQAEPSSEGASAAAAEIAQLFSKFDLGRHWLWPYLEHCSLPCLRQAAACVLRAAGLDKSAGTLQGSFLPCQLMAPCAWVHARGSLNVPVLRCLLLRLLHRLMKTPFASVTELAKDCGAQDRGLIDVCELSFLLELAVRARVV